MSCEEYQMLIMGQIDDELDINQKNVLQAHLQVCGTCRIELERHRMIKEIADSMKVKTPEDQFWDGYWAGIYNRLERRFGWVSLITGFTILIIGGICLFCQEVAFNSSIPLWIRCGLLIAISGLIILFGSILRERSRAYRQERYKDLRR